MTTDKVLEGRIASLYTVKGYGFVTRGTGPADFERYFMHFKHWKGKAAPAVGQRVRFEVLDFLEGPNPTALNVQALEE